jgi:uncharacterized membrane protein YccC
MRTRYLVFVTFMTPYILILFYILNPTHFKSLIGDRILDTAIGSVIAYIANVLLSPAWAYKQFGEYFLQTLEANKNYFRDVASFFAGKDVGVTRYKLSRKEAYVALANISDALNRMLNEPKRKQKNAVEFHQMVVLNYMMASHTATLASIARSKNPPAADADYFVVIESVVSNLDAAMKLLKMEETSVPGELQKTITTENDGSVSRQGLRQMNEKVSAIVYQRKKELEQGILDSPVSRRLNGIKSVNDQFNFISKISEDLIKILKI